MADFFSISVSGLQAFQTAIAVTGNNIANANTPGYDRERVDLMAAPPLTNGVIGIGSGVVVSGISRTFSQAAANQLNTSQSSLGQLNALQSYTNQIDNLFGTSVGGLSTALQGYYSAWSNVADAPTSTASRQALLGQAQGVVSSFQNTATQLVGLKTDINSRITNDVQQINSISASIAVLNQKIVAGAAGSGGHAPNELLDQRDQQVSDLSKLVGVSTTTDSNGAMNIFIANGQPLVLQSTVTPLTTLSNPFDASRLEVSNANSGNNIFSNAITGGDLGGLFAARSQVIDPTLNQLGKFATALSQTANAQQGVGFDLNGQLGANLFSVGAPQGVASANNTGGAVATVSIANLGALTGDSYVLSYKAGAYSLTRSSDNSNVPLSGAGTVASPLTAEGLSIVLSATPASGDQFSIQPASAGSLSVVLSDPSKIAAAGAIQTSQASSNTGSAAISSGTVLDATNASLLNATTIQFTSATTYSVNGAGSFAYTSGGNIALNGWQVQISGTPATGDVFTVKSNAGGTGDNRNALATASQQSQGVFSNGTVSITGGVSSVITGLGSQAQQVNTAQTAQAALNSQALTSLQSQTGVNLDEEAANLLQWQQSYQAAAKALQIGSTLFQSLLSAVGAA